MATVTSAARYRGHRGPALLSMGFRPFFLFASIWAAFAVLVWVGTYAGWLPARHFDRAWHAHEMIFGYLSGVIAGFLLTAVPNWTGRLPVTGAPLAGLFLLWCAGRVSMLIPAFPPAPFIDGAFLFVFALVVGREVAAGRNARNAPVVAVLAAMAIANAVSHARAFDPELGLMAERAGVALVAMLVALIGGRIVPSFTHNWMAGRGITPGPASPGEVAFAALSLSVIGLVCWIAAPHAQITGLALVLAGALHFVRLAGWRGWRTGGEPLVLVLHVGYFWLALGLVLLGLAGIAPQAVPAASGLHALTAGAFGVMTLAVMTRASLGHTGQALTATPRISAIYLLANLGALLRVASPLFPDLYAPLLAAAALLWAGAFAWFALVFAPLLLRPRQAMR